MSGPAAARAAAAGGGPLNSALGQWAVLGLGAYAVAGPEKAGELFRGGMRFALSLMGDPSMDAITNRRTRQPIVIHNSAPQASNPSRFGVALRLLLGAGLCWGSYAILTSIPWIPESIKSALPVSRSLFDRAVSSLAHSITSVRDSLLAQISSLSADQDELGARQDETHSEVLAARTDLHDLRFDVDDVRGSLGRCESSLGRAERRTSYAARGVGLLVRCVRAVLPADAPLAEELDEFGRAAPEEDGEYRNAKEGNDEIPRSRAPLAQERSSGRDRPPHQSPPATPLPRPSRRLERMDSVPERTDYERPEAQAPPTPSTRGDVDVMSELRNLLNTPDRRSFRQ